MGGVDRVHLTGLWGYIKPKKSLSLLTLRESLREAEIFDFGCGKNYLSVLIHNPTDCYISVIINQTVTGNIQVGKWPHTWRWWRTLGPLLQYNIINYRRLNCINIFQLKVSIMNFHGFYFRITLRCSITVPYKVKKCLERLMSVQLDNTYSSCMLKDNALLLGWSQG